MLSLLFCTFLATAMASEANGTTVDNVGWDHPNIPYAIVISLGAGLATVIGGSFVLCPELLAKIPQAKILGAALALSAGVMIYVSFIEIFGKSFDAISSTEGISEGGAAAITTTFFFAVMGLCALLELLVKRMGGGHDHDTPAATTTTTSTEMTNTVEVQIDDGSKGVEAAEAGSLIGNPAEKGRLTQMGVMTALAIGIHNFPEGLATFLATIEDTALGASLGVAIAIHNIPEGLCVAMPIYYATGSKAKALFWCFISGVTEPIGGLVGFALLQPVMTPMVFGVIFGMVGGMMVFIVCHELLPSAHRYMGNNAATTAWLIGGMVIMALSLVLFVL
jgi:ZIP family zinc transporter